MNEQNFFIQNPYQIYTPLQANPVGENIIWLLYYILFYKQFIFNFKDGNIQNPI